MWCVVVIRLSGMYVSEEDGSKHFLVDFEQKTLTSQAERRRMQQQKSEVDTADQPILDKDDKELASEKQDEDVPSNPDEQWSVVDNVFTYFLRQNFSLEYCMKYDVCPLLLYLLPPPRKLERLCNRSGLSVCLFVCMSAGLLQK